MPLEAGERWKITAKLIPHMPTELTGYIPVILPQTFTLDSCEIEDKTVTVEVRALTKEEAEVRASEKIVHVVNALLIVARSTFSFQVTNFRNMDTGAKFGRLSALVMGAIGKPVSDAEVQEADELARHLANIGTNPPRRLGLALDDFRRAIQDGSPFAFVHLHRCLEQIREYFGGGWAKMREALLVSEDYLRYITTRRSSPEFNIAHAPVKRGPKSPIPRDEVREGINRASEVLRRFIRHLAGEPAGDEL